MPGRTARIAITAAFALFVFGGPFARRVLEVETHWLHPWAMYHSAYANVCEIELEEVRPDGSRERVDRFASISPPAVYPAPRHLGRVGNRAQAYEAVRAACEAAGEAPDVRMRLRCRVEGRGLVEVADGSENVCEALP